MIMLRLGLAYVPAAMHKSDPEHTISAVNGTSVTGLCILCRINHRQQQVMLAVAARPAI